MKGLPPLSPAPQIRAEAPPHRFGTTRGTASLTKRTLIGTINTPASLRSDACSALTERRSASRWNYRLPAPESPGLDRPPVAVDEMQEKKGSELAQELHYARIISPLLLPSASTAPRIAGGESLCFNGQVCLRIYIGCVQ